MLRLLAPQSVGTSRCAMQADLSSRRTSSSGTSAPLRKSPVISSESAERASMSSSRRAFASEAAPGDRRSGDIVAVLAPPELPHCHEVDDALEAAFATYGKGDGDGLGAQLRAHLLEHSVEVRAHPVHLVDVGDARHMVAVGLVPDRLRLGLDAADRAEDRDRPVEYAQGALDLGREVDVAGRVDDVDLVLPPEVVVAALVMVMPRSCSCSIQSIVASPSSTSPIL